MSSYTVKLPDVGEGVAEAEIIEWHVHIGDHIDEDDVIVDVMTDKATVELPSPVGGTVSWLGGDIGDTVAVGASLVTIETENQEVPAPSPVEAPENLNLPASTPPADLPPPVADGLAVGEGDRAVPLDASTVAPEPKHAPTAAPAVRARAVHLGVDLGSVNGTGQGGRVLHGDLDKLITRSPARTHPDESVRPRTDQIESVKITGLRRHIAERMSAAKRRIPHFTYVEEIDVTELELLRSALNAERSEHQAKLSILAFLMRGVVGAVSDHPLMNARFDDDAGVVHRHRSVHLGIAVQTARGLMVPVVRDADRRDLWECATELARLSESARSGRIKLDELTGSTITITSLGALGGIVSTPVINAPEVAIVGVNKIVVRPVFVDGLVAPRKVMNLSSSFDHRVIDGADAAAFIQTIRRRLETPALLFLPSDR